MDTYLSPIQAAKKLRVKKQRINQWLNEGRLPSVQIAGRRVIPAAGLKRPKPHKRGPKSDPIKAAS